MDAVFDDDELVPPREVIGTVEIDRDAERVLEEKDFRQRCDELLGVREIDVVARPAAKLYAWRTPIAAANARS